MEKQSFDKLRTNGNLIARESFDDFSPRKRADRTRPDNFSPGGRGLSRGGASGRVEDAGRGRDQPLASLDPFGAERARSAGLARRAAYQRGAHADRSWPPP